MDSNTLSQRQRPPLGVFSSENTLVTVLNQEFCSRSTLEGLGAELALTTLAGLSDAQPSRLRVACVTRCRV